MGKPNALFSASISSCGCIIPDGLEDMSKIHTQMLVSSLREDQSNQPLPNSQNALLSVLLIGICIGNIPNKDVNVTVGLEEVPG